MIRNAKPALTLSILPALAWLAAASSGEGGPSPSAAASGLTVNTIALGETELDGGTTEAGEINPDALSTAGPDAAGSWVNEIGSGDDITDLTCNLSNASGGSFSTNGGTTTFEDGEAHLTFGGGNSPPVGGNESKTFSITSLAEDGSGEDITIDLTPSIEQPVGPATLEANVLPSYAMTEMSDSRRHGVRRLKHDVIVAFVHNEDTSWINVLSGEVTFPGSASAELSAVHLLDDDSMAVSGASIDVEDDGFVIGDFSPLDEGEYYRVVVVLDASIDLEPFQLRLIASFE